VRFYEFSDQLLEAPPIFLVTRDKGYTSAEEVWRAMARDPSLVVLPDSSPGGVATLQGVNGPLRLRIIGNQVSPMLNGVVASSHTLAQIETWPAGTTVFLKLKPGADPAALAREINRSLFSHGVQAATTRELLDLGYEGNLAWLTFFDVILRMGLLV